MLSTFQAIVIIAVSFVVCWILSVVVMIFGVYDVTMAQAQLFLIDAMFRAATLGKTDLLWNAD